MPKKPPRRRRDRAEWTEICRRFESSGLSSRQFCKAEGLALSSLQRWRRRLGTDPRPDCTELVPTVQPDSESWSLEIALPNGIRLRLRG